MDVQWPLLIFGLLAGLGMGCLGFVSASVFAGKFETLRVPGLLVALVALALGGLASALHMGNPARVLYILGNLSSGITQELLATVVAGIVILALLVAVVKNASAGVLKALAVLGLVVAVVLPFITGHAYVQGSRPAWDTLLLPVMYVGAAGAMGLLAMYLLAAVKKVPADELALADKAAFVAMLVFAATIVLYLGAVALAPYQDASRSLTRVLVGDLAPLFWGAVVVVGLAVPVVLTGLGSLRSRSQVAVDGGGAAALSTPAAIGVALVCLVAGSVAIRMLMYLLGSSIQAFIY